MTPIGGIYEAIKQMLEPFAHTGLALAALLVMLGFWRWLRKGKA